MFADVASVGRHGAFRARDDKPLNRLAEFELLPVERDRCAWEVQHRRRGTTREEIQTILNGSLGPFMGCCGPVEDVPVGQRSQGIRCFCDV